MTVLRSEERRVGKEDPADTQGQIFPRKLAMNPKAPPAQPDSLHVAQVPNSQRSGKYLSQHCGDCRAHHPPAEHKDEYWIQNDIGQRPRQGRGHSEFRTSVGADDRVEGLAEHIEWYPQGNPKEILFGMAERLFIDLSAEQGQDRLLKGQIERRQNQFGDDTQQDRTADALVGGLLIVPSQADADKSTAAVSNHYGNGQRHYRQRKNYGVGSVAVGTKIFRIGNKYLIHYVVECRHQKRDDTGQSILCHQLADPLSFKKSVCFLLHDLFLL